MGFEEAMAKMMEKMSDPKQLLLSMLPFETKLQVKALKVKGKEYIAILIPMPKFEEEKPNET